MVQKHRNVLPPESEQSAHKSLITSIGRQLITDFHPAVKNVSLASQNLLRSFQSISHHFYAYTAALYALGYSSSNSEEVEVREQSKRLQRVTEVLKTVHSEQIEWMDYFTSMTLTVSQNSKTEKERLKALLNGFTMRERQLTKAIHRGKQMPDTLSSFYETELEAMRDQQVQRYRFFADKHLELLRRYREWMQFSLLFFEELNLDEKDELTNLDNWRRMGRTERQMDEFGGNDEGERETDNGNSNRMRDKPKQEETERAKNGERMAKKGEGMDKKRQPHEGAVNADGTRQEKGKSAMEEAQREAEAQRTVIAELEKKFTTEDGWSAGRRREFPAKLFRPTPIMPTTKYRHSVADGMLARNIRDSQVWKTVVKIGAKGRQAEGRRQRNTAREEKQPEHGEADAGALRHFYEDKPTGSDATQRLQRNGRIAVDEKEQNDNGQKDRIGQTELRKFHFDTALSLEQCHARGESQDSSGSNSLAKMHRNMSPKFGPLDYGRLIECTTPFNGQEDNQLSLMAGERVLLVKSGTRGWVLGKSTDGTRSGWFPAKYVKLVC